MPFLLKNKDKAVSGILVKTREPDQPEESEDPSAAIESCAQELIRAVHARDVKAVSEALKDAFDILESMPHEEGEHTEPHSYDAQNEE